MLFLEYDEAQSYFSQITQKNYKPVVTMRELVHTEDIEEQLHVYQTVLFLQSQKL